MSVSRLGCILKIRRFIVLCVLWLPVVDLCVCVCVCLGGGGGDGRWCWGREADSLKREKFSGFGSYLVVVVVVVVLQKKNS